MSIIESKQYKHLQVLGELPVITRDGYQLSGWFTDPIDGTQITKTTRVTDDCTYYAHWNAIKYPISYDIYGHGTLPTDILTEYTIETEEYSPPEPLTSPDMGYEFIGWTPSYIPFGSTGSKTFTANWNAIQYKISYDMNGVGSNPNTKSSYTIEEEFTPIVPHNVIGYEFLNWTPQSIKIGTIGDVKFTANWSQKEYSIHFETNGGSQINDVVIKHGSTISSSTLETSRDGYIFSGWYYDQNFEQVFDVNSPITKNLTLFAKWSEKTNSKEYFVKIEITNRSVQGPIIDILADNKEVVESTSNSIIFKTDKPNERVSITISVKSRMESDFESGWTLKQLDFSNVPGGWEGQQIVKPDLTRFSTEKRNRTITDYYNIYVESKEENNSIDNPYVIQIPVIDFRFVKLYTGLQIVYFDPKLPAELKIASAQVSNISKDDCDKQEKQKLPCFKEFITIEDWYIGTNPTIKLFVKFSTDNADVKPFGAKQDYNDPNTIHLLSLEGGYIKFPAYRKMSYKEPSYLYLLMQKPS